ncbi:MAG: AAA family ATPase [Sedimentisphaerales bacterium]|nr:AAA family ATPase [Sedimentisphaerales bacterium]
MKLKTLKISNFVGIKNATVSFDKPVTLFAGRNNQGKSTVKDAIEYSLTGLCRAMKFKKDKTFLTHGGNGMATELLYEDHEGAKVIARGGVHHDGDDWGVLHYCLHPSEFITLAAKERAGILSAVLGGGMDEVVKKAIIDHIGDINEMVLAEVKGGQVNLLDVDAFRKEIVEIRRSYKRLIADLPDKPPLLGDYELEEGYDVAKDQVAVKTLAERIQKGSDMLAAAKSMLQTKAEIHELEKAIKQIESDKKDVPNLPRGVSKKKLDDAPVLMVLLEDMLKGSDLKCECPVCSQKTERGQLKAHYDELVKWYDKYKNSVRERTEAELHNQRAETEKQIKEKLLSDAKVRLKDVDIPKGGENLLAQLQNERDQAQARIANFRRFEIDTSAFKEAGRKREGLTELVAECDRIDEALKDGGPVKAAMAAGGQTLPINVKLLNAWGMADLHWFDNGEIHLHGRPIEWASQSERQRAACLMGMALAEVSGVGVAAIDQEFDSFDEPNRNALLGAMTACQLNNVLIFNSTVRDYRQMELPDWLSVFGVEQGKFQRIH